MITIGRMPRKTQGFFDGLRDFFPARPWRHFWNLALGMTIAHAATLERLAKLLRNSTHRTNHGEFLWRSHWDESWVLQQIALDTLGRLARQRGGDRRCFFIIDETQTIKRAKKMQAVGSLFHHASGKYATGHTLLKVCLWYRGVTIPWGTWLYVKKQDAPKLGRPFRKLTELAAEAIRAARLPEGLEVTVLFDAYYLCPTVVQACLQRGWHFIGVGKHNRRFAVDGVLKRLGAYGTNVLRRSGRWHRMEGLRKTGRYRLAERYGHLKKLGAVRVVFSRRRWDHQMVALVTSDFEASMKAIVAAYLKRWAIEVLIKEEKQQLGLGDYRVLRYRAVVRHLHLVDVAYACLTHLALQEASAQGQYKTKDVLRLPAISELKARMRQIVWQEAVGDVIKHSHEKAVVRRLERLLAA